MWSTATRPMSFSGNVEAIRTGLSPQALIGVAVDAYRFYKDEFGVYQFEQLNQLPAMTDGSGTFEFSDLPVSVSVQTVIPGTPPYEPIELVHPDSLPNLTFRVSAVAESGTETQFVDIYDERSVVDDDWVTSHTDRQHVPLTGSAPFAIEVPDVVPASTVPDGQVHFLRVGRTTRDEIDEIGGTRPGYMNSDPTFSFFPGIVDAPFGRTLQIGGHFGANFLALSDNLYYTVSFWEYTGIPTDPFNPTLLTNEVQILEPLFNKKYILPTLVQPKGQWQTINLGPFDGQITSVEDPAEAGLIGTNVQVYKRPPVPDLTTEYWPFWDLLAIWNSAAAPNALIVLTIEVYEKTGMSGSTVELKKRVLTPSVNDHLPLQIDNRPPAPKLLKLQTGMATFSPETVYNLLPFDSCGVMPVTPGQVNENECIVVEYSIEDGDGNAHPHVRGYGLSVRFTPRGALSSKGVNLKSTFTGFESIQASYSATLPTAPTYTVQNFESVLVPSVADAWPPEPNGDPPSPCAEYAAAVTLAGSVRTIDGWARAFSGRWVERFIIIKR